MPRKDAKGSAKGKDAEREDLSRHYGEDLAGTLLLAGEVQREAESNWGTNAGALDRVLDEGFKKHLWRGFRLLRIRVRIQNPLTRWYA